MEDKDLFTCYYMFNTMAVDVLAQQVDRISADMILTYFLQNIPHQQKKKINKYIKHTLHIEASK